MNIHILKKCYEEAVKSKREGLKYNHGAVCLNNKRIISTGHNSRRTSWLQRMYATKVKADNKTCEHAEVAAIRKAKNPDSLVVVRVAANGDFVNSKPCPICSALIKDSGIKDLYYSTNSGEIKHERVI